jgi:hypothetical protein
LVGKQEHGGNLDEAINAHFGEVDRHMYGISFQFKVPFSTQSYLFRVNYILNVIV